MISPGRGSAGGGGRTGRLYVGGRYGLLLLVLILSYLLSAFSTGRLVTELQVLLGRWCYCSHSAPRRCPGGGRCRSPPSR